MSNAEVIGRHIEGLEDTIRRTAGELDSMITERDNWKQNCAILENENASLRKQINRTNATRDFYMKQYAALQSIINGVAGYITEAVKQAEISAYGGQSGTPRQPVRTSMKPSSKSGVAFNGGGHDPAPAFLTRQQN